jgi:hypothetical protein
VKSWDEKPGKKARKKSQDEKPGRKALGEFTHGNFHFVPKDQKNTKEKMKMFF